MTRYFFFEKSGVELLNDMSRQQQKWSRSESSLDKVNTKFSINSLFKLFYMKLIVFSPISLRYLVIALGSLINLF